MAAEQRARRRASRRLFGLQLALGIMGLAVCGVAVAAGVRAVHVRPGAAHRVDVAGLGLTYPAANAGAVVVLVLAALGTGVLIAAVRATARQVRGHRRMVGALPVRRSLAGHPAVLVVDAAPPLAFCAGWLRPRVYVSTGILDRLSERELRAVLSHERQHEAVRDPLRLAVSHVLSQALFFLPALRSLHATYADAAELSADAAALEALDGAAAPLASAMLAVGGVSDRRVDALLGRPVAWRLPSRLLTAAFVTIAMLGVLAWRASASASVQATLNLPFASPRPCVLVLALLAALVSVAAAAPARA